MSLLSTLTVIPTYQCTAACQDCCFGCNPSISHRVDQGRLLSHISEIAELPSMRMVCFSGGEVFLLGKDLVELVQHSHDLGLLTRIVTNGYWATSEKAAQIKLKELVAAGLNEINFSTGKNHTEWVPVERVLIGLNESVKLGLTAALMIESIADSDLSTDSIRQGAIDMGMTELNQAIDSGQITVVESPWMPFEEEAQEIPQEIKLNRKNLSFFGPCQSIFRTLVLPPSEKLGICCGLPREEIPYLSVDQKDKGLEGALKDSLNDLLKIWIFTEGPEHMLAYAGEMDPSLDWEDRYTHPCDTCRRVLNDPQVVRALSKVSTEKVDQLLNKFALYQGMNSSELSEPVHDH